MNKDQVKGGAKDIAGKIQEGKPKDWKSRSKEKYRKVLAI